MFRMFIPAVCVLFFEQTIRWPKNKSIYDSKLLFNENRWSAAWFSGFPLKWTGVDTDQSECTSKLGSALWTLRNFVNYVIC